MPKASDDALEYLGGAAQLFEVVNKLQKQLKSANEINLARRVIAKMRKEEDLLDELPPIHKADLCRQHAELTSKDPELSVNSRHDIALKILGEVFDLGNVSLNGDAETLGTAGGICKRRWMDLGQYEDLQRAAEYYRRGALGPVGDDGYAQINAAFMQDLLGHASATDGPHQQEADLIREKILGELPPLDKVKEENQWWNAATRAEALFGVERYGEAAAALKASSRRPEIWRLQSTAQQFALLAQLRNKRPLQNPELRAVFEALLPGAAQAVSSALIGKVGLALSGGGFRASYYHLGVLARLAELDVLRHVDVLSCVSGGSIVGACYWMMLRNRLLKAAPMAQADYISLVHELIAHFDRAVAQNLRGQPSKMAVGWRFLTGAKGALDTEKIAAALEKYFYGPLWHESKPLFMHHLAFKPVDHDPVLAGEEDFNPAKHNWLRSDNVPVLVLNATTVNTGHAWQFTPTWMGESPWSTQPAADSVPRLQWHWYDPGSKWEMELARAVSASACVPGLFEPLRIDDAYEGVQAQLIDGGVHDNQGTLALLAHNCRVLIVSDAAGQLLLEQSPTPGLGGLTSYAARAMDTLMERVRLANYADLAARVRTKLVRGLMFLHMKDGLDADVIRLKFSQESYDLRRNSLSPLGVRKDFQKALAELRTDLDAFSDVEANALMACGYRMAATAFERDLRQFDDLYAQPVPGKWPFDAMLQEIKSTAASTPNRESLLNALRAGSKRTV
ncbi:MAG TPA: patatin-like phospholipase family protein [Candidatus Limnocylindrales bacterium]|nr:patatin-like phospholipase family protein [Candidatus Limnocylindrales bacterium]